MTARKCVTCNVAWPHVEKYARCPGCNDKTGTWFDADPLTLQEAESLSKELIFNRFYEAREAKRAKRGDPTPEALGALQVAEIRELEESWTDLSKPKPEKE